MDNYCCTRCDPEFVRILSKVIIDNSFSITVLMVGLALIGIVYTILPFIQRIRYD